MLTVEKKKDLGLCLGGLHCHRSLWSSELAASFANDGSQSKPLSIEGMVLHSALNIHKTWLDR